MAIEGMKIFDNDVSTHGLESAPDVMIGSAQENKRRFDQLVREIVKVKFNELIDALSAATGAGEIGALVEGLEGENVQALLEALKGYADELNERKVEKEEGKGLSANDFSAELKEKLDGIEAGANKYVLPAAGENLGGVKAGSGITIAEDGTIFYDLPIAGADRLGGVKQGVGVEIEADGTINGTAAPAPDLVARAALDEHVADNKAHFIDEQKVAVIEHLDNEEIHVTEEEKEGWSAAAEVETEIKTLSGYGWEGTMAEGVLLAEDYMLSAQWHTRKSSLRLQRFCWIFQGWSLDTPTRCTMRRRS